jgi:hypothetical protein
LTEKNTRGHSFSVRPPRFTVSLGVFIALQIGHASAQGSAEPGDPMRIVILVDNSQVLLNDLPLVRRGLQQFVNSLPPNDELMLVASGGQMNIRVKPTRDYLDVVESANAIQVMRSSGNALISSVEEIYDRYLRGVERRYPMLVVIAHNGPDMSQRVTKEGVNTLLQQLTASGVRVNALLLNPTANTSMIGSDLVRSFTLEMIKRTDGAFESASPATAAAKLKILAGRIAQQYRQVSPTKAPAKEFRR